MRQKPSRTILASRLDRETRDLIREAGQDNLRLTVIVQDGRQIAEIRPIDPVRQDDIWADYDPTAARTAWRETTGVLRGVDVEGLLAALKAERGTSEHLHLCMDNRGC